MKLYGHPMSTCTRKVLAIFAEKGVAPDFQLVDFAKGEHKQPPHLERQPFGQIPAIEDDGFMLYESRAILRYLDGKLEGTSFTPSDAKARASMEQWISVEASNFSPVAMKIVWERLLNPMFGKPTNEETVEKARVDLAKVIAILDTQLAKTPYLAGAEPTLADISYLPYIEYLFASNAGDLITSAPNVARWWKVMSERPAWQKAIGKS